MYNYQLEKEITRKKWENHHAQNTGQKSIPPINDLKSDLYKPSCPAATKTRRRRDPTSGGGKPDK
jgi:hypothetical protein